MSKRLVVANPDQRMELPLDQQMTIGRDFYNSLSLQDPDVSRTHAIVFENDAAAIVKDLNSSNGVYVNGERVQERELADGDELVLGGTLLFYNPPDDFDMEAALSPMGRAILERYKREASSTDAGLPKERSNIVPAAKMQESVRALFNQSPEGTQFFSAPNLLALLKIFYEMGLETDTPALFKKTLESCLELLGGDEGVVMEVDETRTKLKVLSIRSHHRDIRRIEVPERVLELLIRDECCIHCPNVLKDRTFEHIVARDQRSVHSFIACPITMGRDLFGFIYLDSEDPTREYDQVAMRSLYLVASHLAGLLEPHPTRFQHGRKAAAVGEESESPFKTPE